MKTLTFANLYMTVVWLVKSRFLTVGSWELENNKGVLIISKIHFVTFYTTRYRDLTKLDEIKNVCSSANVYSFYLD